MQVTCTFDMQYIDFMLYVFPPLFFSQSDDLIHVYYNNDSTVVLLHCIVHFRIAFCWFRVCRWHAWPACCRNGMLMEDVGNIWSDQPNFFVHVIDIHACFSPSVSCQVRVCIFYEIISENVFECMTNSLTTYNTFTAFTVYSANWDTLHWYCASWHTLHYLDMQFHLQE